MEFSWWKFSWMSGVHCSLKFRYWVAVTKIIVCQLGISASNNLDTLPLFGVYLCPSLRQKVSMGKKKNNIEYSPTQKKIWYLTKIVQCWHWSVQKIEICTWTLPYHDRIEKKKKRKFILITIARIFNFNCTACQRVSFTRKSTLLFLLYKLSLNFKKKKWACYLKVLFWSLFTCEKGCMHVGNDFECHSFHG